MVGVMLGVCSIMGLPWFVAATVLSISHVNSLKVESECSAPGEQPKFLGIREQRVTGLMIFILMGLSVFMTSVLKVKPLWQCSTILFTLTFILSCKEIKH
jgi:sodium bicarbonate cotransporter 7